MEMHYMSNLTGHGWRKLLRHPAPFTYRIDTLPPVPLVLDFIRRHGSPGNREIKGVGINIPLKQFTTRALQEHTY